MTIATKPLQLTRRKKILFLGVSCFALAAFFALSAELILRLRGFKPLELERPSINVVPGGRFSQKHPTLGYSHIPGKYTVTLGTGYSFRVTHLPNTLRITHPIETYGQSEKREEIWIFGCSITHGWTLDDEQTYPWLLQERFPKYEIVNFGVDGYGTIHSLIQLREAIKANTPKLVILAYGSFHDERNTFLRSRREVVALYNYLGLVDQPYARLDKQGNLQYFFSDVQYSELPMARHSALIRYIEAKYDHLENRLYQSHTVSERLVMEMAKVAREHRVKFVVAGVIGDPATRRMLQFARENGIASVDMSVDLSLSVNTNLPHDRHPSAVANKQYADKLEVFLRKELLITDQ